MNWNENVDIVFNSHKIKYNLLNNTFNFDEKKHKNAYVFIDFDYLMKKFLYTIDYYNNKDMEIDDDLIDQFLVNLLNLMAHYKNYFYNKHDTISFYYIFINNKKYKNNKKLNRLVTEVNKIIIMIPRIYTIYYENDHQLFFLKYNLMNKINLVKGMDNNEQCFYMNIGHEDKIELMFRINKNFFQLYFENYKPYLYGFENFRKEKLNDIDDIYINSILALMPVYVILDEIQISDRVKIDDVILKYIKSHPGENYNDMKTHLLILKMFTKLNKLYKKLQRLEMDLNSFKYNVIIEVIMNNWKHIVKDRSLLNINEIYHIPADKRIMIEILINN